MANGIFTRSQDPSQEDQRIAIPNKAFSMDQVENFATPVGRNFSSRAARESHILKPVDYPKKAPQVERSDSDSLSLYSQITHEDSELDGTEEFMQRRHSHTSRIYISDRIPKTDEDEDASQAIMGTDHSGLMKRKRRVAFLRKVVAYFRSVVHFDEPSEAPRSRDDHSEQLCTCCSLPQPASCSSMHEFTRASETTELSSDLARSNRAMSLALQGSPRGASRRHDLAKTLKLLRSRLAHARPRSPSDSQVVAPIQQALRRLRRPFTRTH